MQRLKFINAKIIIKNMSSPWCHHKIKFLVRQGGTTYVVASYICWARTGWSETAGPCVRSLSSLLLRSCFALACFLLLPHQSPVIGCLLAGWLPDACCLAFWLLCQLHSIAYTYNKQVHYISFSQPPVSSMMLILSVGVRSRSDEERMRKRFNVAAWWASERVRTCTNCRSEYVPPPR